MNTYQQTENQTRVIARRLSGLPLTLFASIGGSILGLVGLFLPWMVVTEDGLSGGFIYDNFNSFGGASRTDGNMSLINDRFQQFMQNHLYGLLTLLGFIILTVAIVYNHIRPLPWSRFLLPGAAVLVIVIALWNVIATDQVLATFASPDLNRGSGFYLTEAGSALALIGVLLWTFNRRAVA